MKIKFFGRRQIGLKYFDRRQTDLNEDYGIRKAKNKRLSRRVQNNSEPLCCAEKELRLRICLELIFQNL
jgi:hypothetical protein